jgi:hypothetical protein
MPKLRFSLLALVIALLASPLCLGKKPTWDEAITELEKTKEKATNLVEEILNTNPSEADLLLLEQKYDLAKQDYLAWAREAADAVEHNRNIDFKSEKAKAARSRLDELGKFHDDYFKKLNSAKQAPSIGFGTGPKPQATVQNYQKYVDWGLQTYKLLKDGIDAQRKKAQEERDKAATAILEGAKWKDFNEIKAKK